LQQRKPTIVTSAAEARAPLSIREVLATASQIDGPIRLFVPRGNGLSDETGLFDRKEPPQDLMDQTLGSLLEEVARATNQPRRVLLTEAGLRFLIRHHAPTERAALVKAASPLYQDRLLRMWKSVASSGEAEVLRACVADLYGDLLDTQGSNGDAFEVAKAKELVLSWNRVEDPDVRAGLARAMVALGLRPIGEIGEAVEFTGRLHISGESLFPGDPAEIEAPGWVVAAPTGDRIVQKAQVKLRG